MEIKEYLEKKKMIQDSIHEYIIEEERTEEIYQNIEQNFEEQQIQKSKQDLQELLHLISEISNNHNRKNNFLSKILKIILHFTEEISNYFSNTEIFNIFKNNKKILLFLFEEGLIKPDSYIAHSMTCGKYIKANYPLYFAPEIKSFIQDENTLKNILSKTNEIDDFSEKRKIGENDSYICKLIQNDLIDEFISHVKSYNLPLSTLIDQSIFETNPFLIKNKPNLIEYAAFFGSIQVFKYLYLNKVELTPSLWLYSIHSNNLELIRILEECKVKPRDESYKECFEEAIKCQHNEVAVYIEDNYISKLSEKINPKKIFKSYNFSYFPQDLTDESTFVYLCKYDYVKLVDLIINSKKILPNYKALKKSLLKENSEIVKLLLKIDDFDINYKFWSSKSHKVIPEEWNWLSDFRININFDDEIILREEMTSLHIAVKKRNIEIVKLLLSCLNIDVNLKNWSYDGDDNNFGLMKKRTALFMAIENKDFEILRLLLSNKSINVNLQSSITKIGYFYDTFTCNSIKEKKAPIHLAIEEGILNIVQLLLSSQKINIDIENLFINCKYTNINSFFPRYFYGYKQTKHDVENEKGIDRFDSWWKEIKNDFIGINKSTVSCIKKTCLDLANQSENSALVQILNEHAKNPLNYCLDNIKVIHFE